MLRPFLLVFILPALFACSSRNLRPGFRNEQEVLQRAWTYSVSPLSSGIHPGGIEYVAPVILENTLLFGSSRFGLVSFYPEIKRVKWRLPVENGVLSPLGVQNGQIFFTGGDGILYSISSENGKALWTYDLRNPITSAPSMKGEDLYVVTSDDALLSLELKTGKWQWQYRRRNVSGPTIHGATRPLVLGESVWVGFADGALVALSRKDGKVLWEKQLNSSKRFSGLNAELVESDGLVYVPAYDQALYALNSKNANPVWVKEGVGGSRKVTLSGGVVYAPSSQGKVFALDAKSGKELWSFDLDGGVPSEIVVSDRHIIFGSTHEYIYALDRLTGKLVYRHQVGYASGFSGGLAFDSGKKFIYGLSRGGNLYSFKVSQ
jgi:outer membrane protein assembly factor BamB